MAQNQITETFNSVFGDTNLALTVLAWRHEDGYRVRVQTVNGEDVRGAGFATIRNEPSRRASQRWVVEFDGRALDVYVAGYRTLREAIRAAALHAWFIEGELRECEEAGVSRGRIAELREDSTGEERRAERDAARAAKREDESFAQHALRNGGSLPDRLARRIAAVDAERAPRPYHHVLVSQGHKSAVSPSTVHGVLTDLLQALRAELLVGQIVEYSWTDADDTLTFRVQAGYWDRDDARRAQDVLFAGIGHLVPASVRRGNLERHPRADEVEFAATVANNAHQARLTRDRVAQRVAAGNLL